MRFGLPVCRVGGLRMRGCRMTERGDAILNGVPIAVGTLAILDNIVVHWVLRLHRAVQGPDALTVECFLIALGAVLLSLGSWREWRAAAPAPASRSDTLAALQRKPAQSREDLRRRGCHPERNQFVPCR
jgi:hypothetical protein